MGKPVSSIPRLYKALNLYGEWALFEAIVDSAEQDLNGDPLNYVLAVTRNKWKKMQEDQDAEDEYTKEIEEAKRISKEKNDELAKKLRKTKRKS